jgi:hypothetical protein
MLRLLSWIHDVSYASGELNWTFLEERYPAQVQYQPLCLFPAFHCHTNTVYQAPVYMRPRCLSFMMTVAARSPAEEHRQWINTAAICVDVSYISIATCIRSRISRQRYARL